MSENNKMDMSDDAQFIEESSSTFKLDNGLIGESDESQILESSFSESDVFNYSKENNTLSQLPFLMNTTGGPETNQLNSFKNNFFFSNKKRKDEIFGDSQDTPQPKRIRSSLPLNISQQSQSQSQSQTLSSTSTSHCLQGEYKIINSNYIDIVSLPNDIIKLIALKCDSKSLRSLCCTCSHLNKIIEEDDHLWRLLCERDLPFLQTSEKIINGTFENSSKKILTFYNQLLKHDRICCTGFDMTRKQEQMKYCNGMGGSWQDHLDRSVTVLIVGMSGTDKYTFAQRERIPIVTENWIKECFIAQKRLDPKDFSPPIFIGMKFCATQLRPGVRTYIEDQCAINGAVYTADLRKDYNTHLIAVRPVGRKFEFAHRWNMKVVSVTWLFECLRQQQYVLERDYIIQP